MLPMPWRFQSTPVLEFGIFNECHVSGEHHGLAAAVLLVPRLHLGEWDPLAHHV